MLAKVWQVARWVFLVLLVSCLLFFLVNITETAAWKVLDLLIVPAALALGIWWLNKKQKETELEIAQERNKTDQKIAQDRNQQALLDGYFDRMTDLILKEGLKESDANDKVRTLARTHTLSVIRNLDGKRKGQVLRFLHESGLIGDPSGPINTQPIIGLYAAEFRYADLIMVPLRELYDVGSWTNELITRLVMHDIDDYPPGTTKTWSANLQVASLKDVDLSNAALILTDLSFADLDESNLNGAILALANLTRTNLRYASMRGADLRRAQLTDAILQGADLRNANLQGASVTDEQLKSAGSLEGATMPNGEMYHDGYF